MVYELPGARIFLCFTLITPILRFVFASQAVFATNETIKVPVSLGVTSRDDDSLYVQIVFDNVLKEVSDKVNMSFGYVKECVFSLYAAQYAKLMRPYAVYSIWPDDEQYGVRCSSDWLDCAGNVQQLCVHKYASQKQWWDFIMCQNQAGKAQIGHLKAAQKCAIEAEVPWEVIRDCAGPDADGIDEEGAQLLLRNVQDTVVAGVS